MNHTLFRVENTMFQGLALSAIASRRFASVILLFLAFFGLVSAEWSAFNDGIRTSGGDFTAANVTDWTLYNNYETHNSGPLKDLQTGADLLYRTARALGDDKLRRAAVDKPSKSGSSPSATQPSFLVFKNGPELSS